MRSILLIALSLWVSASSLAETAGDNIASQHLAEAVRFKTVSHQENSGSSSEQAFRDLHAYLRQTYPRVYSQLQVEYVNDFSLVITWQGTDPQQKPVLFTAHSDVVPVEPGTEADWDYPAFDGVIADGVIYGRGTMDDKVGVISLLEAAER